MIITPQYICNMLNEMKDKHPEFTEALLSRVPVSEDIVENSSVMCSKAKTDEWHDSKYSTSVLGFLNAFLGDESICAEIDKGKVVSFKLLGDAKAVKNKEWDKYHKDLEAYNKEHGTNYKPEERQPEECDL